MRALTLFFMLFACNLRSDASWNGVDFQYRDIAFVSGYVSASVYDLAKYKNKDKTHEVAWKMALGLSAGLAISICHSYGDGVPVPFNDIVFGGLGGLTCTVIHLSF